MQSKLSRILVGVDGSPASLGAAEFAISLARKDGAEIYAVNVIHIPAPSIVFYGRDAFEDYLKKRRKEADGWLARAAQEASAQGLAVSTEVLEGYQSVPKSIIDFAEERKADLIVVGSRGMTGFQRLLLGSTALALVTYSPLPVMVAR